MVRVLGGGWDGVSPGEHSVPPLLLTVLDDDDDDGSDQTKNSKKNAEDYQRVLVWHPRARIISVAAGRFG